ncbi:PadR family transcriptional regulator [Lentzea tibetensis]|uniref:PadR family transcriptional regulator n=1 Tax=Lentzea tibetensis TaxID=2591470 RepID=A0A563EQS9_9PSEU|nr:PadR family transcriptional regulator [Lentzea tibetensis]TWP49906.1 PadR family transcriptional regulator [Lentzea tibetensis]
MSATRMLVLGVVRLAGEAHGYQVRRELQSWSADRWANVQPGSIYHALKSLAKDGLVESTGTEEGGDGPARTIYRITDAGSHDLITMISDALVNAGSAPDQLSAGVALITLLPRRQAIVLLEHRLAGLEAQVPAMEHAVGSYPDMGKPAHVSELARFWLVSIEAQVKWTSELLERLRAGEYDLVD